jgi:TatA/E family protein of Tat protein translocase
MPRRTLSIRSPGIGGKLVQARGFLDTLERGALRFEPRGVDSASDRTGVPLIGFGSIGGQEILFIVVLALILFGPRKIPEFARTIGKTLADFKVNLEREIDMENIRQTTREIQEARSSLTAVATEPVDPPVETPKDEASPSHEPPRDGTERVD